MKRHYENDHEVLILSSLMDYSCRHPNFDASYVENVYNFLDKNRYITEKQLHALQKIYQKIINENFELNHD